MSRLARPFLARLPLDSWVVETGQCMNAPHTIKGNLQLNKSSWVSIEKFRRIFERMTKGSFKRARLLNRDDERAVRTNLRPKARQLFLRKVGPGIDPVCVKVCVPATEFATPQNPILTSRYS